LVYGIDQVNEHEMGKAYSAHEKEEECIQHFDGNLRRKDTVTKT
jgi:hypothetical protein